MHISTAKFKSKPKLKLGTSLFQSSASNNYFLGVHQRTIRIFTESELQLARALMHGAPLNSLPAEIEESARDRFIARLAEAGLLDTSESSIQLTKRAGSIVAERATKIADFAGDAAYDQMRTRTLPELAQLSWSTDGNSDGGVAALSARQSYSIELSGNSRITTLLFQILIASGVTNTRISPSARAASQSISHLDIGVGFITGKDFGSNYRKSCEDARHSISLFPEDRDSNYLEPLIAPTLKIHCGVIDPELLAFWMSSKQPYLIVNAPIGDSITVGPLVEPGCTPCLRCFLLSEEDLRGYSRSQAIPLTAVTDVPMSVAHYAAALVADFAISYCDGSKSEGNKRNLIGKVLDISYQALLQTSLTPIARHPLCGCAFADL